MPLMQNMKIYSKLTDFLRHRKSLKVADGCEASFTQLFYCIVILPQIELCTNKNDRCIRTMMRYLWIPLRSHIFERCRIDQRKTNKEDILQQITFQQTPPSFTKPDFLSDLVRLTSRSALISVQMLLSSKCAQVIYTNTNWLLRNNECFGSISQACTTDEFTSSRYPPVSGR